MTQHQEIYCKISTTLCTCVWYPQLLPVKHKVKSSCI